MNLAHSKFITKLSKDLRVLVQCTGQSLPAWTLRREGRAFCGGDLSVQMLQAPWLFSDDTVHLLPKSELAGAEQAYISQSSSTYYNSQGKGRLVLIGNSFSPLLARFLSSHFKEVDHQLVAGARFDASVATGSGADVEILEVVERHLSALKWPSIGLQCRREVSQPEAPPRTSVDRP